MLPGRDVDSGRLELGTTRQMGRGKNHHGRFCSSHRHVFIADSKGAVIWQTLMHACNGTHDACGGFKQMSNLFKLTFPDQDHDACMHASCMAEVRAKLASMYDVKDQDCVFVFGFRTKVRRGVNLKGQGRLGVATSMGYSPAQAGLLEMKPLAYIERAAPL
eukprot:352443-Chlamydomonas_euryale.AAC.5